MTVPRDTISAVATAPGQAALGIIRISGPLAGDVLRKVVPSTDAVQKERRMCLGSATDLGTGEVIDDVLCFFSRGPATATGENVAEIHGHGGPLVLKSILEQTLQAGCRPSTPGEFTMRAYLNQKMDLTQAEAVMSLIGAKSDLAAKMAARQLRGSIGEGLAEEYEALVNIGAQLEAGLDFPEEDLPQTRVNELVSKLEGIEIKLKRTIASFNAGTLITKGAKIVIAGPSNAGKSSLLNAIVREDRALVDSEPGTTRDIVEARFEIEGVPVTFYDTAGLRMGAKHVEQQGMTRTRLAVEDADLVLLVIDGTKEPVDENAMDLINRYGSKSILLANKSDHPDFRSPNTADLLEISALKGNNLDVLTGKIGKTLLEHYSDDVVLTTVRQQQIVSDTMERTSDAIKILTTGREPELAAADVRLAREALSTLWGRHAQTDMIDRIFSSFCLGK